MRLGLVALCLAPATLFAGAFPWAPYADDVRVVADPRLELALRLQLVAGARQTIDIANYDQRADADVALPLATALRDAADRGVRVRFLVSWNTTVLFDQQNRVGELLVDPPTRVPIEYVIVGGPLAQQQGWGLFEGVHEKLLLVDGRALLTTGRGIGEIYLHWLDTAFLLRGPLVRQAQQTFDAVWAQARSLYRPYAGYLGGQTQHSAPRHTSRASELDAAGVRERDALLGWLAAPRPAAGDARARVLHFDFLRQVRAINPTPVEVDVDERLKRLDDPVLRALVDRLATARRVRMAFISTILHPSLHAALLAARQRGAEVTLMVNTAAPRLGKSRTPVVAGGSVWAQELPDLDDLLAAGVRVYGFQIKDGAPWLYLHRKLAILDDTVIFGSHNFNVPSSVFFDEASFEVTAPALAAELGRLFDADLEANGEALDAATVRRERARVNVRLLRWMTLPYLGYM